MERCRPIPTYSPLDASIHTGDGESFPAPPADRLLKQAHVYRDMFALFRRYSSEITSVTLWGLADDNTWLDTFPVTRKDAPLLFDTRLKSKPAYWGGRRPLQDRDRQPGASGVHPESHRLHGPVTPAHPGGRPWSPPGCAGLARSPSCTT